MERHDGAGRRPVPAGSAAPGRLTLRRLGEQMELRDSHGNEMPFQEGRVSIRAGRVDVATGHAKFTGRVECGTLKAHAVIAQSYTPGAGDVW